MKDDDLFDEILNPYESSFEQGKEDGRKAALQAGYDDGYQLGKLKALEIGIELGYMSSTCQILLQRIENPLSGGEKSTNNFTSGNSANRNNHDHERKKKRILDLLDAIEAFPKPEDIFQNSNIHVKGEKTENDDQDEDPSPATLNITKNVPTNNNDIDIASSLQRLRAKFKTVLVQFDLSHLRLKNVMDQSISSNNNNPNTTDVNGIVATPRLDEW